MPVYIVVAFYKVKNYVILFEYKRINSLPSGIVNEGISNYKISELIELCGNTQTKLKTIF